MTKEEYLQHYGIKGMHWGVMNGPPYPLGISKMSSSERRAREGSKKSLSKTLGSGISKSAELVKRYREKKRRQRYEEDLASGDVHAIYKERSHLSNEEIRAAKDRAQAINDLKRVKDQRTIESVKKLADVTNYVNQTLNNVSGIGGTLSSLKRKEKHVSAGEKFAKKFMQNHNRLGDLTLDELEEASKKSKAIDEIDRYSRGDFGGGGKKKNK